MPQEQGGRLLTGCRGARAGRKLRKLLHKVSIETVRYSGAEFKQAHTSLETHLSWQNTLAERTHPPAQPPSLPPLLTPGTRACTWSWGLALLLAGTRTHLAGTHSVINPQQSFWLWLRGRPRFKVLCGVIQMPLSHL